MTAEITETTTLTIDLLADERPERFTGTPEEIITAISRTAFVPYETPRHFMAKFNEWFPAISGNARTASTDSYAAFLTDMIEMGAARLVVEESNPKR